MRFRGLLAIYIVVLGLFSLWVPVTVTERLTGTIDSEAGPFTHQDSAFVGIALFRTYPRVVFQDSEFGGTITDEEYISFDRGRYMVRAGVVAAILCFLYFEWLPGLRRLARWCRTVLPTYLKPVLLWAPLLIYGAAAISRMVYVPCTWVQRLAVTWHPELVNSGSAYLWNVGSWNVNYGLVIFEEIVLLVCVTAWYGATYALSPQMRSRISNLGK